MACLRDEFGVVATLERGARSLSARGSAAPVACLAGELACPPEDCGETSSYADFLAAIRDPQHPQHDEMLEWVGGAFDPEACSLRDVNAELSRLCE